MGGNTSRPSLSISPNCPPTQTTARPSRKSSAQSYCKGMAISPLLCRYPHLVPCCTQINASAIGPAQSYAERSVGPGTAGISVSADNVPTEPTGSDETRIRSINLGGKTISVGSSAKASSIADKSAPCGGVYRLCCSICVSCRIGPQPGWRARSSNRCSSEERSTGVRKTELPLSAR